MKQGTPPEIGSRRAVGSLSWRGMFTDAVVGFRYGALLGLGLILIGVLRFVVVAASHDVTAPKWQEVELLTYYVATFAVAGSIAGAALSHVRSKLGICVLGAVLGPVVVTGLVWAFDHYIFSSRFEWIAMAIPSAAVGAAIALYLWGERGEIKRRTD
jgi:hypothetical protein